VGKKASTPSVLSARRGGFTLLEILVALSAVLVVAIGLAAIFNAVGKTVSAGRRLSRVNQYARLLELEMRQNFSRMSRDGCLVIRQQFADADADDGFDPLQDVVPLNEDDERGRPRRVDEIMFFARGDYTSARAAVPATTDWRATAREARIYYGHGQRQREDSENYTNAPAWFAFANDNNGPLTNNGSDARLGVDSPGNPNRFAKDWILLQHVTLLTPLKVSAEDPPGAFGFTPPGDTALLQDKECQVAGQPACASAFRSLNRWYGPGYTPGPPFGPLADHLWHFAGDAALGSNYNDTSVGAGAAYPMSPSVLSGTVDIATTSLEEIRAFVVGFADTAAGTQTVPAYYDLVAPGRPSQIIPQTAAWLVPGDVQTARPGTLESVDFIHSWMDDLMPTQCVSAADNMGIDEGNLAESDFEPRMRGVRIRAEARSAGLIEAMTGPAGAGSAELAARFAAKADRTMLTASNLVVGCSEFAIDWTFGGITTAGDVAWYGPALPSRPAPQGLVGFYDYQYPATAGDAPAEGFWRHVPETLPDGTGRVIHYPVSERLVYGYDPPMGGIPPLSVTSYFGFNDPTFGWIDMNGDGAIDTPFTDPAGSDYDPKGRTTAWPWPKLVRVRVTVVDPVDSTIESTFELMFEVPAPPSPR